MQVVERHQKQQLVLQAVFVTLALLYKMDTTREWFYCSCLECRSKLTKKDNGLWYCEKSDCKLFEMSVDPAIRYQVKFYVFDDECEFAEFIIWDDNMTRLLGKTAQQLLNERTESSLTCLPPPEFRTIIEKEYLFKIRVTKAYNILQQSKCYGVVEMSSDDTLKQE